MGARRRGRIDARQCGAAFSGYLSWRELGTGAAGCEAVGPQDSILGYPPCVYGLAMYTVLVVLAAWGLRAARAGR